MDDWRTPATVVIWTVWLAFVILFPVFFGHNFSVGQNIAIGVVSFFIMGGIIAVLWTWWPSKMRERAKGEEIGKEIEKLVCMHAKLQT